MIYRLVHFIARVSLGIYFRRIEIEGAERLRAAGPRIFVANHPNTLIDVLLVGIHYPGKIHFLGKSVLFENPLLAWFLGLFGAIPVYRQQDASNMAQNVDSFARAFEVLEKGGAICLFPEGTSVTEPRLQKFKTGAARIALGAEERNGWKLGLEIVPVALAYDEKSVFRSRALVRVSDPIRAADWREGYERDAQETVRAFTAELERVFAELLPQADDWRDLRSVDRVRRLYQDEQRRRGEAEADFLTGVRISRQFLDGYAYYKSKDPAGVEALRHKVDRFYQELDLAGVPPQAVALEVGTFQAILFLLANGIALLVGLPLYLFGLLHNYAAYRLVGILTRRMNPETEFESTYKLLIGLILFPIVHLVEAGVYTALLGRPAVFPVSLFLTGTTGFFTLLWWGQARRFALGIAVFLRNRGRVRTTLEKRRRQILEDVEKLVAAYPR